MTLLRDSEGFGQLLCYSCARIEEIEWSVEDGRSGYYLRYAKTVADGIQKVTVIGQEVGRTGRFRGMARILASLFLVMRANLAGHVEIAFSIDKRNPENSADTSYSQLVVFFPYRW